MGVINMAHGELVMVGAYTAVMVRIYFDLNIFYAIPAAFLMAALVGLIIERLVVRNLYGRLLDTLLATWGVGILVQQAVRLEFGLTFFDIHIEGLGVGLQRVDIPDILRETIQVGDIVIQPYRTFIILLTVALVVLTWLLLYRTSHGTKVRAIMRNSDMAAACGIDVKRVNAITFAYGSGLAGVAGVMISGFKTVSPGMGTPMVVDGFMVVVVGGVGSLLGSVVSAGFLGQLNGIFAMLSNDILARAIVFGAVILIIAWRPNGLFNFRGR